MANLKSLIVNGVSRFLSDVYLSTVKSGVWNGTAIDVAHGGTNKTGAVGNATTPVYLASNGITACSSAIYAEKTISLSSKSVASGTWESVESNTKTNDSGVYALYIKHNNNVYSGVFSISNNVDELTQLEEIPLHFYGKNTEPRLYAAINTSGNLCIAHSSTNAETVTATIKYRRIL